MNPEFGIRNSKSLYNRQPDKYEVGQNIKCYDQPGSNPVYPEAGFLSSEIMIAKRQRGDNKRREHGQERQRVKRINERELTRLRK